MLGNKSTAANTIWTDVQAYTLAVVCLLLGVLAGWLLRGSQSPTGAPVAAASTPAPSPGAMNSRPSAGQLRQMADLQAAPLIEQLKSDPKNPDVLIKIGNSYYDAQQYPVAVDYYGRALELKPSDASVRTDMATAYWYMGDSDRAIAEFNKALSYQPNNANTLFNLGVVKWQGKLDVNGAVADWEKLLATNPNYEGKDKVEQLIAQAKKHAGINPGTKAQPLAE
jgi:cytochrome c-type biogenesis protein CcmH/NrfG